MSRRMIVVEPTAASQQTSFESVELKTGAPHSVSLKANGTTMLELPFEVRENLTKKRVSGFQFSISEKVGEKGVILVGAYPYDGFVRALLFVLGHEAVTVWPDDAVLVGTAYETVALRQTKPITEPMAPKAEPKPEPKKSPRKPRRR